MAMQSGVASSALATALEEVEQRYRDRNAESWALLERASAVMPGGNTRSSLWSDPFPLYFVSGEGCRLKDADGHSYVDLLGEFTAGIFGHSSAVLKDAVSAAHANGINLSSHNTYEVRLAELLTARFPSMDLLRFCNSGTEANLMAVALAKIATSRERVVVFEKGYHGGLLTFGAASAKVNAPHKFEILPYDDVDAARALFAAKGAEIACVLVEPMQGAGGCRVGSRAFLAALRDLTAESGAVLIFDEVQTARMGEGGLQKRLGIIPDLTTIGKFFGGGLGFGCFGGRRGLMERLDPRRPDAISHAGTFNNNTLTMAAGIAAAEHYLTAEKLDALFDRGEALRSRLEALFADRKAPYTVTGLGSIMNIHGAAADHGDSARLLKLAHFALAERGYYFASRGLIALSLAVGDTEIDGFLNAMAAFLDESAAVFSSVDRSA
ncbi:aminotransferase class III-fold pyridoxal phosphate-dependent enzyme [Jiella mangrovi]|uniref:Aminotransferase class III-fold pyridoxal phosphate-dependent enzyme n=1 Tax=Jiella mangrovi TaxID=2821407 RepID=A0ABS4BGB4_9HYPH|nr:aminotransferase class III-fold pyridoxal phosphate-dependent enzyme [Jiella mangrovi]MBP0615094.1 aminotransferase class III-fold pyridoxal phosphate-dependent enzyme [Jiella mangrovi]